MRCAPYNRTAVYNTGTTPAIPLVLRICQAGCIDELSEETRFFGVLLKIVGQVGLTHQSNRNEEKLFEAKSVVVHCSFVAVTPD